MNYTLGQRFILSRPYEVCRDSLTWSQTIVSTAKQLKTGRVYIEKLALTGHKYWSFAVPWRDRVADNRFTGWYSWAMQCVFVLHADTGNSREIINSPTSRSLRLSAARSKCYSFHWEQCGNMFLPLVLRFFVDLQRQKSCNESPVGACSSVGCEISEYKWMSRQ